MLFGFVGGGCRPRGTLFYFSCYPALRLRLRAGLSYFVPSGLTFRAARLALNLKRVVVPVIVLVLCCVAGLCAEGNGSQNPAATGTGELHNQQNAAGATKDTSATSGDQATKPAGAHGSTVIGCVAGPDADDHYTLTSMQYRNGVEVAGPDDLRQASGKKVKLTGHWEPGSSKTYRRFQATQIEVVAEHCQPPVETSPVSKKKQAEQKAKQQQQTAPNPE